MPSIMAVVTSCRLCAMNDPAFVPEIEQNLLGAILSGGDHRPTLARLTPEHFLEPAHAEIYRLTCAAQDQYGTTTMPTVIKLASLDFVRGFADHTGMPLASYLAGLVSSTPFDARNIKGGAKAVVSQWARLGLKAEAAALMAAASDPSTNPAELARAIVARADEIASHLRTGGRTNTRQTFAEAAQEALTASIEAKSRKGLTGITSGIIDLDRATGGLQRRDLILIGARPSMGKTTLGTSIARHAAASGVGVGIFSLEMDSAKLAARMVSDLAHAERTHIPYMDMIAGHLTDEQEEAAALALEKYSGLPILLDDASGLTIAEIRAKTETMIDEAQDRGAPLGLLIIDHLGKVKPSARYAGNRNNEIGEITDGLKALAREYDLAVVLLSQLSRQVEARDDKRPLLSDLRDSGNIEQDADAVMFLHRQAYYLERAKPEKYDERIEWEAELAAVRNRGELAIAKQRNGPCSTIDLFIDVACSAVRNAARSY
ncbi:DnaB-like helicase C-terminal domain-containing protein [Devosia ginsengisoli]|uniref:replicative DNA helicase n=1 Tax=Devosia ginsengisoli TaxID=400770 RepID=UPI0026F2A57D|nr:DnaB-like helicase C-terminal domain-containing protein [Devosia ginsengisoli]MCR6671461.1 AAA family ATPase [Devosia ginsengisoli]